jgi:PPP family 3-phenylpropionic acid transporter
MKTHPMKKIYPFFFYLLYFGANACFFPYIVLYYQSLGFTGTQIGLLSAISPLISLVGAPFWTGLADVSRRHRLVMSITLLVSIGLVLTYPLLKTISAVFIIVSLYSFMIAPVNSFADSATMTMLGDQKNMYGRIRAGGTIGWGFIAPIAGIIIERFGLNWAFWSYSAIMFIGFLLSQQFKYHQVQQQVSIKSGLRDLFSNRRMVLFLVTAFVTGMALMAINVYLAPYLAELGIRSSFLGVALAIATISELPVLFFGNRLLAKLKPHGLLILSMCAVTVRLFFYAIFQTTAGILWFQLINGFTFAALWVAGVSYINENAPPGLSATTQAVFGAAVFGFGAAGGGFIGGILLEQVGGAAMFAFFGFTTLLMLIVYTLLERRLPQHVTS